MTKRIVLALYVLGAVTLIKGIFRYGIVDGVWVIVFGLFFIVLAFYINKYFNGY